MRFSPPTLPALALIVGSVGLPAMAMAQANPSTQQLINQLRPGAHMDGTTRGIRMLPGGSAGASASSRSHASAPDTARPSASLVVDFLNGSAELTPQATAALDQLGTALTSAQLGSYRFKVIGHTDTTGSASLNQTLSTQRAEAVKDYLKAKFQIADDRLQAIGVGQNGLAVPTPPNTSERRNRRVEIINLSA
ncbi:OmpA family protein [Acetobacter sp. TBRC 12305]|uniref:OmpA family protein n=1 Tax=Acetobacter garciniae TaxID=2817435 RepID=A0A939KR75_9PROT|nr:OmpA family protein [Acetobacter garciniae]MBO1326514.1 OmpA family protein [Acetobacter garciniae]MBX0346170.1 OmpA family protein [Acetobacter garciniae]